MKKVTTYLLLSFVSVFATYSIASDFEIKIKSESFTPAVTKDLSKAIEPLASEVNQEKIYRLIQFYEIPTEAEKRSISDAGIELISYMPSKAFICSVQKDISSKLLTTLNIRSLLLIDERIKLSYDVRNKNIPEWALTGDQVKLKIRYYSASDKSDVINALVSHSAKVIHVLDEINTISIECSVNEMLNLSKSPLIQWIEFVSAPNIEDDTKGASSTRSNTLNTDYSAGRKYNGTGVVVGLADDGLVGPHIDFEGRMTDLTVNNNGDHGDMTSGIFVGAGNLDPTIRGMASGADIYTYSVGQAGITGYPHIDNAVANFTNLGTVLTSTSYSQGTGGVYDINSVVVDEQIYQNELMMHVFSAGNSGTSDHGYGAGAGWGNITGGSKAGKNVICSGNLTHLDVLTNSSSRGPAADGRIKPDLCANGIGQLSTDENNTYQVGGGTSAAAPTIAGVFAQLIQAYKDNNGGSAPESALIKSSLMNTAEDLDNPGPDFKTGWGRVNGLKAVRIIEENRYIKDSIGQSETDNHTIVVPANVSQLRVMTYWTDKDGNPASAVSLVNDINMQVTDPSSVIYNPLVLDHLPNTTSLNSVAVPGIDNLNNVEQVRIDNPVAGTYSIELSGNAIPFGPQKYFIVYDFIYDAVELTYPIGGEGFVPGESESIRWDAPVSASNFSLEYSTDGGSTYTVINNFLTSTTRSFNWNVPNVLSNTVKVRINQGIFSSESDTVFTIVDVPQNIVIDAVCPDSILLSWDAVAGVSVYEVSMLGNKYMDSIGTTTTNSIAVYGLSPNDEHWFSVKSIVAGGKGRRVIAVKQVPGTINCSLNDDLGVTEVISPNPGFIAQCTDFSAHDVTIKVNNYGATSESNISVYYQLNSGAIVTEVIPGPIAPGSFIDYTFSATVDLSSGGLFNLSTWVVSSPDDNLYNDTLDIVTDVLSGNIFTPPYSENFNSFASCPTTTNCELTNCYLTNGWVNYENVVTDDIDWRTNSGTTTSNNTGPTTDFDLGNAAGKYLYLESSNSCTNRLATALSPCIDLSDLVTGTFEFAYHMYGTAMGELHVDVIGQNNTVIDAITPIIGNQGDSWFTASVDLAQFAGDTVNFRFRGTTGTSFTSDIAIDAISVVSTLGLNEGGLNSISAIYYPVPSAGIVNMNISGLTTSELEMVVTDIDGRVILSESHDVSGTNFKHEIDLSNVAKGVYFVRLNSNNGGRVDRLIIK